MGRRAAQLWKNQEQLTDLGIVNETLTIEDQLRVKIALRMMRKAHTKTSRSEAERKRRKNAKHTVEHIGEPNSSMQDDAVKIRTLEDIMKEARNNFALMKDQRKMEKDSHRYGQLRPIYTSLVNEIREEQMERQRLRDEREENEVESLHSDGAGGKFHRPSRVTQGAKRRNLGKVPQRPHSAAATIGSRTHSLSGGQNLGGGLRGSNEAPAKLQGERASVLSKASHHNIDPVAGQSANRRHELMPVRSAEVLAMNNLEAEMAGHAHGRISRTQKELMHHVKNAQQRHKSDSNQLPPLASSANKGRATVINIAGNRAPAPIKPLPNAGEDNFTGAPSSGKFKSTARDRTASSGSHAEVKFAPSPSLHVLPEDDDGGSRRGPEDMEPEEAAENLVRLLKLGKYGTQGKELSERELTPSQMLARGAQQRKSFYGDFDSGGESGSERVRSFVALREQASAKRSSFFSASAVRDDEKISRAQLQREEIYKVREDELKQRIMKKQQTMQSKAEQAMHEQRQRALSIAVISLARWSLLTELIIKYRATHQLWKDANATKKAIGFIERWWRRGRVRIVFRRHPHVRPLLRRVVIPFVWRMRLRRKRRAATLIVTFLQDSTGMSETMRAIYAFRHTVIRLQRWIRSWIEVQQCRMRILWLKCERMYRDKLRSERGSGAREEAVKHPASQFAANYFTETAEEIAQRRKQLGRLLEDQEFARAQRQEEARFHEEAMLRKKAMEEARRKRQRLVQQSTRMPLDSAKTIMAPSMKLPAVHNHVPGSKAPPKKPAVPWHVKIRSSASNCKIYDLLREVLGRERKRHILNLVRHHRVGQECKIGTAELRRYLKNPSSYDGAAEISKKLAEVQIVNKSPAQIFRSSFLLLTMGGIDALDILIQTNRFIKF